VTARLACALAALAALALPPTAAAQGWFGVQHRWEAVAPVGAAPHDMPEDIAAEHNGSVYVLFRDQVQKYDPNGTLVTTWTVAATDPSAVEVDGLGHVYVTDPRGDRVLKFTAAGQEVGSLTGFRDPLRLGSDAAGNLYVGESGAIRIGEPYPPPAQMYKVSPAGEVLARGPWNATSDISVAPDGRVYSLGGFQETIGWRDPADLRPDGPILSGLFEMWLGDRPDARGLQQASCCGLADASDRIWVARGVIRAIEAYSRQGYLVEACPTGSSLGSMAAGRDGKIYLLDGRSVVRYGEPATRCDTDPPEVTIQRSPGVLRVSSWRRLRRASLTFSSTEQGTAELWFRRLVPGRRVGGRCLRPTRRNRGRPSCVRRRRLEARFWGIDVTVTDGGFVRFAHLMWRQRLPDGRYELSVVASDRGGHTSAPAVTHLRVIR
jgi:hypothetical protein